ncbi:MAG TPA: FlgD immunoglobulin-like domain containing protein, partial [bacterium]|nr:FlgD immunoglobulin-like domain containing protein [bacterium]
ENCPNPFNPVTRIAYDVPVPGGRVELAVYGVSGALVRRLLDEVTRPGRHVALWDGTDGAGRQVSSGIYFYRLTAPGFTEQRKMVLLK